MLKKAAFDWSNSLSTMASLEKTCVCMRRLKPDVEADPSGLLTRRAASALGDVKRVSHLSDLDDLAPDIRRFEKVLARPSTTIDDIKNSAKQLRDRCLDELDKERYFQLDRSDVPFYGQKELFGPRVASKFKDAAADIENAGNCLALQQPTACVFHLMRAMEVAVRSLARRLKIQIGPKTTWRVLTGNMDDKIKLMPDKTNAQMQKRHRWEEARANLHHVGSAWRNNTMHPAAKYTSNQARNIFEATRVFMQSLCDL